MSEELYAMPDLTKKVRFQKDEDCRNTEVFDNNDNVKIYDNYWTEENMPPKSQDNTTEDQQQSTCTLSVCVCLPVSYVQHAWCLRLLIICSHSYFSQCKFRKEESPQSYCNVSGAPVSSPPGCSHCPGGLM